MTPCTVCGSSNTTIYIESMQSVYTNTSYQLLRCADCTHIFTDPIPSGTVLNDIYTNHYAYDVHLVIEHEKRYRARKTAQYIVEKTKAERILEPGCMYGFLLTELQGMRKRADGIEIDHKAAHYARAHGLDVKNISLEAYTAGEHERYDLVVLSHALEHIVDINAQLTEIQKVLNDAGMILIIVPNTASWSEKIMKKLWGYWQVPVHLNHFNAKSLSTLVERNGYDVVDVSTRGGDSLLFLSFIANIAGFRAGKENISGLKKIIIQVYSAVAKYWYHFGNDDLVLLAKKR